jgi:CheY-like chemotaxis protein
MLTRLGYCAKQIIVVDNGQKAVDAVVERVGGKTEGQDAEVGSENDGSSASSLPLLVFMDVHMPVMNGLDATRAIRSHSAISPSRQPYIIALTANAMSGDQEMCLHHGMDDYLPKPVTMEAITAAMRKARAVCLSRQRVSSS